MTHTHGETTGVVVRACLLTPPGPADAVQLRVCGVCPGPAPTDALTCKLLLVCSSGGVCAAACFERSRRCLGGCCSRSFECCGQQLRSAHCVLVLELL